METTAVPTVVRQARTAGGFFMEEGDKVAAQKLAFFSRRIMLNLPLLPADFGTACDLIDLAEAAMEAATGEVVAA